MIPGGFQLIKCSENKICQILGSDDTQFHLSGTQFQSLFPGATQIGDETGIFIGGQK